MKIKNDAERLNVIYVARQLHPNVPIEVLALIGEAASFAFEAHRDQKRKGSGDPYIVHPQRVAKAVDQYVSPEAIAAAYLHDVVEDTIFKDLSQFPRRVQDLVEILTRKPDEGKNAMIDRIGASMDSEAILLKMADRIDNLMDSGPHFNDRWLKKYAIGGNRIWQWARDAGLAEHPLAEKLKAVVNASLVRAVAMKKGEHDHPRS